MKGLTYSSIATARLRANKRQYLSLVLGIFLSIFMVSSFVLGVYAIYQRTLQNRYDKVGNLDMVVLDNDQLTDEAILALGDYDRLGHAYVTGSVAGTSVYLGYYDQTGSDLLDLTPVEGRMPEAPGEIVLEASAMDVLEAEWQIGETVELKILPVDGTEETRQFTVVGFLPEHSVHLEKSDHSGIGYFPAVVTCRQEPAFSSGRVAFHYMMGIDGDSSLSAAINHFWEKYLRPGLSSAMYGLSISGKQVQFYSPGEVFYVETDMMDLITMVGILAAALILSCGVGISGAMEGVLSKRREEIGVLRALGATRRQIRRMFGRENLILALVVSPVSIVISCGAVWVLALLMPESLKFAFNLWLILPIAVFSVIVILVSGYLPLVRASRLMPMSVIRDTAMLRRSKGVKSKKVFSAPKLIASRQVRFNPTRQIGAVLLVGLMLLCSGLFSSILSGYANYALIDPPGFYLRTDSVSGGDYIPIYQSEPMNQQSLRQIENLDHVESIHITRELPILVTLDTVPRYAMVLGLWNQMGMLDDAMFQEVMSAGLSDSDIYADMREAARAEYLQFLQDYQFSGEAFQTAIVTIDLNQDNLDMLQKNLSAGSIDVEAINSGKEVLVYAPDIWVKTLDSGGSTQFTSEEEMKEDPRRGKVVLSVENETFHTGQTLPLTQLYQTDPGGAVSRNDVSVQAGGIVTHLDDSVCDVWNTTAIITTEEGLAQMGLRMEGLREVSVYLDGELTLEEEEALERQLAAISRRSEGYYVVNLVKNLRMHEQEDRQTILLLCAVITVFFAVSVGMIVSSVTRQLHSQGRTIGMLRAVGADEKAILGCYCGQLNAAVLGGLGISAGFISLLYGTQFLENIRSVYYSWSIRDVLPWGRDISVILVMAGGCWFVSRHFLRHRIREIVNKSIIDNIREL